MCGIVGMVGDIFKKEEDIFADLLRVDVVRGPDSTGVATIKGNREVKWVKDACLPDELINDKAYRALFYGKITAVIGHNRWATRGRVISANAHPFTVGKIVGVHNGTLTGQHHLPDHRKFVVDSENIMHSLDLDGVDATVGNLQGAYCLVWINNKDNTINFLRNKERPLFLTLSENQRTLFYASEGWMLAGVLSRHGKKHGDIWPLPEDTLFTYHLGDVVTPVVKPHCRKLEGRQPPPPVKNYPPRFPISPNDTYRGGSGRKVVADLAPTVGGVKWRRGDRAEFRITSVARTGQASPMWKAMGLTLMGGGQIVVCYLKDGHHLLEKFQKSVGDVFVGHIQSLWFNERSRLHLLMDPNTLSQHQTVLTLFPPDDIPFDVGNEKEEVMVVDRDGNVIPVEEFKKLTKNGCAWCSEAASPDESEDLVWLDCDEYICKECAQSTQVKEYLDGAIKYLN